MSIYKSGWIILTLYKYVLFRFFAYFFSLKWVNKEKSVGVITPTKKHEKNDIGSNILIHYGNGEITLSSL